MTGPAAAGLDAAAMPGPAAAPDRPAGFWTPRKVAWYVRANGTSDYAERVLAAAAPALEGCRSALDVGAGFGALAVPLARRLDRVTALEPAPAMAAALRSAAARGGVPNLGVVEAAWGEIAVAPHDLVLCAHVGSLLRPGAAFLREVSGLARRRVVLVRDAPDGGDKFFFRELYPALLGRPYERAPGAGAAGDPIDDLRALGIEPGVTVIEYASDQPFDSLEEACDFWMAYMGLETGQARTFLRGFLGQRLERHGGAWLAPLRRRAAVIAWTAGRP